MFPQYRYQWLRNSSFSSNKDINPTRLARDWEEEALETGSGAAGRASGGAAGQVPPPSSGRGCPSDVRVHTGSAELGDLWNVLALTEQRRRRAQATLGPGARPPRRAALPIGRRPARARSSLV